jgi:hypothetical protein
MDFYSLSLGMLVLKDSPRLYRIHILFPQLEASLVNTAPKHPQQIHLDNGMKQRG